MQGTILRSLISIPGRKILIWITLILGSNACGEGVWNNPYPAGDDEKNILYSSFDSRPKHLDPVRSYSANEYAIIGNIYEPPLQYHYLKRPYTLVPLTATEMLLRLKMKTAYLFPMVAR